MTAGMLVERTSMANLVACILCLTVAAVRLARGWRT